MATTEQQIFTINGVIDTNRTNMENLQILANNCGSWISYDENTGKWGVVINKAGTSSYSFTDDDIIGSITLVSSPLDKVYNAVEVTYPNKDIEGGTDNIVLTLPAPDWYTNELENKKQMNFSLCDNPIQAQYLAYLNLNQSRRDEVVQFNVHFGHIDIKAGDIFDITNTAHSWTNREFRALRVVEKEQNGDMFLEITGVDYSADTYDITEIVNYDRTFNDGILSIGSIGQAGTPQVTKFEQAARPHILIESTVPEVGSPADNTTVVTDMEYWVYIIPASELPNWELVDDDTRVYQKYATVTASDGTYEPGDTALLDVDTLNSSNFLVKTRARNDKVTGPFSETSGLVTYTPAQTTDIITPEVEWYDILGQQLAGMALMKLLEDLFNGNLTGPGSLYDKIMSLFEDDPDSGNFLAGTETVQCIYYTSSQINSTPPYNTLFLIDTVDFPYDGYYAVSVYADGYASSPTSNDYRSLQIYVDGVEYTASDIGVNESAYGDFFSQAVVYRDAGGADVSINVDHQDTLGSTGKYDITAIVYYLGSAA